MDKKYTKLLECAKFLDELIIPGWKPNCYWKDSAVFPLVKFGILKSIEFRGKDNGFYGVNSGANGDFHALGKELDITQNEIYEIFGMNNAKKNFKEIAAEIRKFVDGRTPKEPKIFDYEYVRKNPGWYKVASGGPSLFKSTKNGIVWTCIGGIDVADGTFDNKFYKFKKIPPPSITITEQKV